MPTSAPRAGTTAAILLGVLLVSAGIAACGGDPGTSTPAAPTPAGTSTAGVQGSGATTPAQSSAGDTVVYTITGGYASNITSVAPGGSYQTTHITSLTALPWSKSFSIPAGTEGPVMELEAENGSSGSMGCSITVNGQTVASDTSSGEYRVVNCTKAGS
ncbi:MAG TPA: hypothetical protein VGM75_05165 [Pseudonocardiaceae bacterium]